ncbi:MAG TPA: methyltransferase domain-containing protein [Flexivirga sp.]|uniref:class I SAM-dependent methyltransferase n=1 Tax=Flexivirga sp. TaxID=1962927 RepID=UPI002D19CAF1|nr:methyltransferase domain-containing protein [Flexivirga sp.]HWC23238.1 methyltransferase domain-containing protein [Flexivirga sp.]
MAAQDAPMGFGAEGMWDTLAGAWDDRGEWHATVTRELTEAMLESLDPQPHDTVIEVACGPTADIASAVARRPGFTGTIRAGDLSAPMVQAAERRALRNNLDITFLQLDVTELPLKSGSVDRLAARWIYMLLPDPLQGLSEAARVLRPTGSLVFAVFASAAENPFFMVPGAVLAEHGLLRPPVPGQPSMFALADVNGTHQLVRDAGFTSSSVRNVPLTYRLADPDDLWSLVSHFAGPISLAVRSQDEHTRDELRGEIERRAEQFRDGTGYALPGLARIFTASF